MVITLFDVQAKAQPNEIRVRVTGKQWWWEYEYLNLGDPHVVTANELVIPVNRPVFLELESADVIHSFWVPKLAGKQDVVPERTNTLQLIADRPDAVYEGQCAEFCALGHANMRLRVFTKTEAGFDRWVAEQRRDALEPTTQDAIAGKRLFFDGQCVSCHAIRGTEALARLGPDLTHFASRTSFAGSSLRLTGDPTADRELLFAWVKNTRKLKPGVVMPVFEGVIPDDQINLIVAYLLSLK
jgi:cytochrome c oxidase subunit 2